MGMKAMKELRDFLCQELDEKVNEIKQRGGMSSGDLETANKIVLTMEKIDRIEEIEKSGGGYSMDDGSSYYNGMGVWSADNGMSGRGAYNMQPSYRRGRSMTTGRYMSRDDGKNRTIEELEKLMSQANLDQNQRNTLQQAMQELQNS